MGDPGPWAARIREAARGTFAFPSGWDRFRHLAAAAAWPSVIVIATLILLRKFAFGGLITNQHVDVLAHWLPNYCMLGRSLASGNIPDWNPHVMAGLPFAADPQSGWGLLPAMGLFGALPCYVAIRWYVVLLPIQAGLGLYAFGRAERLSRPAAATGGIVIALAMAGSRLTISLPFGGALAWTAVMLALAAKFANSTTWHARILWGVGLSVAWGQLAATHLSHGLVLGTLLTAIYIGVRLINDLRLGRIQKAQALLSLGMLALAVPLINLAILLPRISYLARSTPSIGFSELLATAARLRGLPEPQSPRILGFAPSWPLTLVHSPGAYFGAASLALTAGALRARRHLHLTLAFALSGALCYVATLEWMARLAARHGNGWLADLYVHNPMRFLYGTLLSIAVLSSVGLEAWRRADPLPRRLTAAAIGVVLWWLLPFVVWPPDIVASPVFIFGLVAGSGALVLSTVRPTLIALVPAVLALELLGNGMLGQRVQSDGPSRAFTRWNGIPPLQAPALDARAYLQPGTIARYLQRQEDGRYVSFAPRLLHPVAGYNSEQSPGSWELLTNGRSTLFGVNEAQGYNPVQPTRYWSFTRIVGGPRANYNKSFFRRPSKAALDLLEVGWIVGPADEPPLPDLVSVVGEGRWALYRVPGASDGGIVTSRWRLRSEEEALHEVTSETFDPSSLVILEEHPGIPSSDAPGTGGTATYERRDPDDLELTVESDVAALVLIRNTHDPYWSARVDGRPTRLILADYFLQAVVVPPGEHTVRLTYRDPTIRMGLVGSALSIALALGATIVARGRGIAPRPAVPANTALPRHQQDRRIATQATDRPRPSRSRRKQEADHSARPSQPEPGGVHHHPGHDQEGDSEGGRQRHPLEQASPRREERYGPSQSDQRQDSQRGRPHGGKL